MKRTLILLALPLVGASAQAAVVDDFSVAYFNTINNGTWVDFQGGGMIGGERDVEMEVVNNPFNTFADLNINGSGMAISSSGFGMSSNIYLQYDGVGDEAANTGPGTSLINGGTGIPLLNGSDNSLRLAFLGNDLDVNVTVTARVNGTVTGSNSAMRLANSGNGNLDVFLGSGVLNSADSLTIEFSGVANADFAISKIETVPEPVSMIVLGAGAFLAARRRRSTK